MVQIKTSEKLKNMRFFLILLLVCVLVLGVLVSGLIATTAVAADSIVNIGQNSPKASDPMLDALATNPYFAVSDQYGQVWTEHIQVDVFKLSYENGEGRVTVAGKNNTSVIAPGTENSYAFAVRNVNDGTLDYKVIAKAWFTGLPSGMPLPVEVRLEGQDWLMGSETTYEPLNGTITAEEAAVLMPYQHNIYTLQWRWPFERDLNGNGQVDEGDSIDTWLASQDHDITLTVSLTVLAAYHESDHTVVVPVPGLLDPFNHWAYLYGYEDGTIRPEDNITRGEVAAIFYRLLKEEYRQMYDDATCGYTDVPADSWYYKEVAALTALGILEGYPDGTFRGEDNITRAEMAAILFRISQKELPKGNKSAFKDIKDHWAEPEIMAVEDYRWIEGRDEKTFAPDDLLTRAETAAMVNRMVHRLPEKLSDLLLEDMLTWPDNMNQEAWYYMDIQEASNYHEYVRLMGTREKWTRILPVEPVGSQAATKSEAEN